MCGLACPKTDRLAYSDRQRAASKEVIEAELARLAKRAKREDYHKCRRML